MTTIILIILGWVLIGHRRDTLDDAMVSVMASGRSYATRYYSRNPLAAAIRQLSQPPQSWSAP
jgi:hypothetical protein